MNVQINKFFYKVLVNSLSTQQMNYLGEMLDEKFNLHRESGFSTSIPVPRQNAAETILYSFQDEDKIVHLFTIMLMHEGERFYNRELMIWGKEDFIRLLIKNKWIYDSDLKQFLRDPFYENEINFLKKLRIIDLRHDFPINEIINEITEVSKKMSIKDLQWRISIRLYDLDSKIGELIRKIIGLLLARQNLQVFTGELFICLKELAINASKANYKLLFEKHVTSKDGLTADNGYIKFLNLFKEEIENNGNKNLLKLAQMEDRFINLTFQSSTDTIEIWVTNSKNISAVEKRQIMRKLGARIFKKDKFQYEDDEYAEGAGLGLNIILSVLGKYSSDKNPLKVVFYPDFIKIGFQLKRSELLEKIPKNDEKDQMKAPEK
jgi:hypothetical protein